jgi:hypothetical protein
MMRRATHLTDETLVRYADGELGAREATRVRDHLEACWSCRVRLRDFDAASASAALLHRENAASPLPSADGPRALLRARLRQIAEAGPLRRFELVRGFGYSAAAIAAIAVFWTLTMPGESAAKPRPDLTPGAVRQVAASDVCAAELGDNSEVQPAVQRLVFEEYGMPNAETGRYEVDYLITPALGGSDDIRNLWPQPYSGSPWNAYVKDALEAHLRRLVCAGTLDLATAQREIAVDWIAAYKKYFRTTRPLAAHRSQTTAQ